MSQNDIDKIKERLSIEEVVSSYIQVEKAGKNLKARCPFHNEKTPSFYISPDRGSYYCFGCGAKGDIFTFVEQFEGLDFYGALKQLAQKAGVTLSTKNEGAKNQALYDILEEAKNFYQKNLKNNKPAYEYLKGRGLTNETISEWAIGFANESWDDLAIYLKSKNFKEADIEKAGLIKKRESGSGSYNRFRNRIMFPIFDSIGRAVAFTGRLFSNDSKEAKYVNSPETELFTKSRILYGFNVAKTAIRKNNFSILVEGQVDIILAHQAGYKNAVASSGTALTEEQLQMINKISNRLIIAYDADKAGIKASERAWQMALELGMDIKIAKMPSGSDPADLIKKSKKEWIGVIKNSVPIIDYMIENVSATEKDPRKLIAAINKEVIPYISKLSSEIEKAHYIKKLKELFNVEEEVIWREVNKKTSQTQIKTTSAVSMEKTIEDLTEKQIVGLYFWIQNRNMGDKLSVYEKKLLEFLDVMELESLKERNKEFQDQLIFYIDSQKIDETKMDNEIEESIFNYKIKTLKNKRLKLKIKIIEAEKRGDEEEIKNILREMNSLSKIITDLSG
jgi:DNA primase